MTSMELMMPTDASFLFTESREHPMHVAGLQLFDPPDAAGPGFVDEIYRCLAANREGQPAFRKRPATLLGGITSLGWQYDNEIDTDYHVRRSVLPYPGRVRELLQLVSQLHSHLLDRHYPLWEMHVVDGLADGRFAIYSKFHHALLDGASALMLLQRALSDDPRDTEVRAPWNLPPQPDHAVVSSRLGSLANTAGSLMALGPSTVSLIRAALVEQQLTLPFGAPRTLFNVKVGGARRCAAQSWSLDRFRAVAKCAGVTINDVVLAMCAGALRQYLLEQNALPDAPLVALVPVSLRSQTDDSGGTMVGTVLCGLATDNTDPAKRLEMISQSMRRNKKAFSELSPLQAKALWAFNMAPLTLTAVPGFVPWTKPSFNVIVSNLPGPTKPMYWHGARLDSIYPLSIAHDGQALSITLLSNAGTLEFGLVGCRRSVPHLQRLLLHLETSLHGLEQAVGL
ncbi:conserved hypothetical membrane protein [Mycobacterium marinum E11]|nr:hypothetical protein MMEU_4153 [Mycobacterium marinum str. Europe]CDM74634.1 conserved hypothetical membrane protein [Mycobacterium marinum E11]